MPFASGKVNSILSNSGKGTKKKKRGNADSGTLLGGITFGGGKRKSQFVREPHDPNSGFQGFRFVPNEEDKKRGNADSGTGFSDNVTNRLKGILPDGTVPNNKNARKRKRASLLESFVNPLIFPRLFGGR